MLYQVLGRTVSAVLILPGLINASPYSEEQINSVKEQGCSACCSTLQHSGKGQISYANDTVYNTEQASYWSLQQSETYPLCRFTPSSAEDVSFALKVITHTQCQFAVKSGGHVTFKGGSNIEGGMTIDLSHLSELSVSEDRKTTYTGTGNRWENVYAFLDPKKLAVVGSRESPIGVGGLTLGGGMSFFSGSHGWACDNVNNYQVVLANGSIVDANTTSNPDLYFALRGGGNNFGIVTRMDLNTFEQGLMWGGETEYNLSATGALSEAFYWYNKNAPSDPKAALILAAVCSQQLNGCSFFNSYEHSSPTVDPPIFDNFTDIKNTTSSARITNLLNLTDELAAYQLNGYRQIFLTATFKNNATLIRDLINNIWYPELQPVLNFTDSLASMAFQPITQDMISHFSKNGGNALGITEADGELMLMDVVFQWSSEGDSDKVISIAEGILNKSIKLAESRGLLNRFLYQNYAYSTQDVFSSYGEENKARLIAISKAYDPDQVFEKLQPGYFKLISG